MNIQKKTGLTLIEIILAMAILGILVVAFLPIMGNSFVNIINMGNRTKALALAQKLIDQESYDDLEDDIIMIEETNRSQMLEKKITIGEDIDGRYCITDKAINIPTLTNPLVMAEYNAVTVMVYYGRNNEFVVLTAMTKKPPTDGLN